MKRLLSIVALLAGCAHGPTSYSDMELWYKDCRPYKFLSSLTVITPQSPGSTVMSAEAAPKRALVKRPECAASGSWQVVDLIPSKPEGSSPTVSISGPARYDLRDVPPPFGDPR